MNFLSQKWWGLLLWMSLLVADPAQMPAMIATVGGIITIIVTTIIIITARAAITITTIAGIIITNHHHYRDYDD